jgi:hypothetical protein
MDFIAETCKCIVHFVNNKSDFIKFISLNCVSKCNTFSFSDTSYPDCSFDKFLKCVNAAKCELN